MCNMCVACVRTVYRYSCNDEADKNDSNTNYLHCTAVVEHIRGGGGGGGGGDCVAGGCLGNSGEGNYNQAHHTMT